MITIKEIASLAGVSQTTVSNVIHGRTARVSEETLEKVRKILKDKDYVSNMGAQIIGNHGSRLIALVLCYRTAERETLVVDPFAGTVIGAVENAVRERGYFMILYNNADMDECLQMARAWNIEGMILVGAQRGDYYKLQAGLKIPMVSIDTIFEPEDSGYYNVGLKDFEGMELMTDYLVSRGHRKIAFLTLGRSRFGYKASEIDILRQEGYMAAMKKHGIKARPEWMTPLKFDEADRIAQFEEFVHNDFLGCTALFFASDQLAMEAIMTMTELGVKVPDDISVAGFDDIKLAHQMRPRLTTIHQDFSEKGKCAVQKLMKLIEGDKCNKADIRLPVSLVVRDTVKDI